MTTSCHPLTPDRLADLVTLFESNAETRGCWCMYWRLAPKGWRAGDRASRRAAWEARVAAGPPPGVIAYRDGAPIGWAQVTPRAEVPRFNNARSAKPATREPDLDAIWALSCFFIHSRARGQGVMTELAVAACEFAAAQGARAVEAAPLAPRRPLIWGEGYVGIRSVLERAGFEVVEQRTELRALMRWTP